MNAPKLYAKYINAAKALNSHVYKNYIHAQDFKAKENILEIGCGIGESTRDLLKIIPPTFNKYVSTDLSNDMIKEASLLTKNPGIQFEQLDISAPEIKPEFVNHFDKLFSFLALHWIPIESQAQTFKNLNKLLKHEGSIRLYFILDCAMFEVFNELYKKPQWAQYMKHAREYSSPYNHTVNGRLSILENFLVDHHFKINILSMQEVVYKFENFDEFFNTMRALNPYESKLPENLRDLYWKDSIKAYDKFSNVTKTGNYDFTTIFVNATKLQEC